MESKRSMFLDSNPESIEKNLRFVKDEFEDKINDIFSPLTKEFSSKVIKPQTGFCIKAFQTKNQKKIFVNVCHTDGIPAPIDISEQYLTEILQGDEPHSYKVPMSLSDPRLATDKTGKQEMTCDIAKINKPGLFQNFFITLIFEALESKYDIEISEGNWKILNNRTVFGSLVPHRIQDREVQERSEGNQITDKKPLIEEISDREYANSVEIVKKNFSKPDHKLIQETYNGAVVKLISQFQLPECVSSKEIILSVNDDRLVLECNRHKYLFDGFTRGNLSIKNYESQFGAA
uniref:CSON001444 protein n=1 Tax=Culicoides sonorensis TaxID=179676 RepID=A0A336LQV1_CULSO